MHSTFFTNAERIGRIREADWVCQNYYFYFSINVQMVLLLKKHPRNSLWAFSPLCVTLTMHCDAVNEARDLRIEIPLAVFIHLILWIVCRRKVGRNWENSKEAISGSQMKVSQNQIVTVNVVRDGQSLDIFWSLSPQHSLPH